MPNLQEASLSNEEDLFARCCVLAFGMLQHCFSAAARILCSHA